MQLPFFSPLRLMDTNRAVAGVNMGHMWHEVDQLRDATERILQLFEEGKIEPHVDRTFPFTEAAEAHRFLESGKSVGKVVLAP